ncbi:YaaA family protein [Cumulibacter soli]|uniref:YaaA family protein n=1 Tax=Cumulibacter soli TaxID=2546344 RepID=UPI0010683570|nr:peroxide stress protein YaaA [Cumulibacter soli]
MRILLPPSEGKFAPVRGKPLDLFRLSHGELTEARAAVLDELIAVSGRADATKILKVGAGLTDAVAANVGLRAAPTAPAKQVYNGVLFDALDEQSLQGPERARMTRRVLIFSALFGVLRTSDRIPAYRLSGSVTLPGIGGIAKFWRQHLGETLTPSGLIVDCRSASYAAMWSPDPAKHLPVRVFRESNGERTVVSHMAKHSRGLVARALCQEATEPRTPGEAVDLLNGYFAATEVKTATGAPVDVRVELGDASIDVITS